MLLYISAERMLWSSIYTKDHWLDQIDFVQFATRMLHNFNENLNYRIIKWTENCVHIGKWIQNPLQTEYDQLTIKVFECSMTEKLCNLRP